MCMSGVWQEKAFENSVQQLKKGLDQALLTSLVSAPAPVPVPFG
jgi:hypothetical protein